MQTSYPTRYFCGNGICCRAVAGHQMEENKDRTHAQVRRNEYQHGHGPPHRHRVAAWMLAVTVHMLRIVLSTTPDCWNAAGKRTEPSLRREGMVSMVSWACSGESSTVVDAANAGGAAAAAPCAW